ncbi:MAG TPA: thioredoxin domain-containing protein [Thermoanaerobacterales bacterium]|nr:thioredoxin domain-containing protein [Thermoanaerobacterales bacterium]
MGTLNIEDVEIIEDCIRKCGIDFESWLKYYKSEEVKEAVEKDLLLVEQYDIQLVPTLVINGKQRVNGAQPLSQIIQVIEGIVKEKEQLSDEGASCRLVDGRMGCD